MTTAEKRRVYSTAWKRKRDAAIRAGAWTPHHAPKPVRDPTEAEAAWAAGFFQGEGHVARGRPGKAGHYVSLHQLEREPLLRLQELFGGSVRENSHRTSTGNVVWRWVACGENARRFASRVAPWLSGAKRQSLLELPR